MPADGCRIRGDGSGSPGGVLRDAGQEGTDACHNAHTSPDRLRSGVRSFVGLSEALHFELKPGRRHTPHQMFILPDGWSD